MNSNFAEPERILSKSPNVRNTVRNGENIGVIVDRALSGEFEEILLERAGFEFCYLDGGHSYYGIYRGKICRVSFMEPHHIITAEELRIPVDH